MSLANQYFDGEVGDSASPTNLNQPRGRTAGGPYMARLGDYQFSLETASFDTLQRSTEYRWAAQDRIGRDQAQQFLGMGEDRIELRGTIYPHFRGGLGQLALMREAAGRGKPLPLIYAFERVGQYNGLWCIKSVSDERSVPIRNGAARKIEFSLCLVAYGEDADISAIIEQRMNSTPSSPDAGEPPPLSYDDIKDLFDNSLTLDDLLDIYDDEWSTEP